jgi:hypothetical protein
MVDMEEAAHGTVEENSKNDVPANVCASCHNIVTWMESGLQPCVECPLLSANTEKVLDVQIASKWWCVSALNKKDKNKWATMARGPHKKLQEELFMIQWWNEARCNENYLRHSLQKYDVM